jgi:serine/threonine protein phosphatase 1
MNGSIGFVGDVHGNVEALRGLWGELQLSDASQVVYMGDYINKGPDSAAVIEQLIEYSASGRVVLLRGNHELALLDALESRSLAAFLKMGGAATIRSYVRRPVRADVLKDFEEHFPEAHLDVLRSLSDIYESEDLIARHIPGGGDGHKFEVSAHVTVGPFPHIGSESAQIDTGCGTKDGRLTAFLWPSRGFVQVDNAGVRV